MPKITLIVETPEDEHPIYTVEKLESAYYDKYYEFPKITIVDEDKIRAEYDGK